MPIYKAFNNSGEHNPFPHPLLLSRRHTRVCAGAFAFLKAFGGTNESWDVTQQLPVHPAHIEPSAVLASHVSNIPDRSEFLSKPRLMG